MPGRQLQKGSKVSLASKKKSEVIPTLVNDSQIETLEDAGVQAAARCRCVIS